jgi:hypothetical protein
MNSRNVAVVDQGPDLSKIAKARRKKGRHEPLGYSVCNISPRLLERQRAAAGDGHSTVRSHFVRGHFKQFPSGLHWWSPHLRGSGDLEETSKTYVVT